jgi:hypothetical protein
VKTRIRGIASNLARRTTAVVAAFVVVGLAGVVAALIGSARMTLAVLVALATGAAVFGVAAYQTARSASIKADRLGRRQRDDARTIGGAVRAAARRVESLNDALSGALEWQRAESRELAASRQTELSELADRVVAQRRAELAELDARLQSALEKIGVERRAELSGLADQRRAELADLVEQRRTELAELAVRRRAEVAEVIASVLEAGDRTSRTAVTVVGEAEARLLDSCRALGVRVDSVGAEVAGLLAVRRVPGDERPIS